MKKLFILFFILITFKSNSQEYKKTFLGKDVSAYKGLFLKLEEKAFATTHNFYSEPPVKAFQAPVYKPTTKYNFVTDTSALIGREFLVQNVSPYNASAYSDRQSLFELKDINNNEIIYFIYDSEYDFNFPFKVKGFKYNSDYFSKYIEREMDDFTGQVTLRSPILNDISISKFIKNPTSAPTYYLRLSVRGSTLNYNGKGVIVLFKDGTKWSRPNEKIDVEIVKGEGWGYRAFITLTNEDLKLFSTKEVNKFRLYIYDNSNPDEVDRFQYYTQAIIKMK
jgi:hypothetical protein